MKTAFLGVLVVAAAGCHSTPPPPPAIPSPKRSESPVAMLAPPKRAPPPTVDALSPAAALDRLHALDEKELDVATSSGKSAHDRKLKTLVGALEADHKKLQQAIANAAGTSNVTLADPLTLNLAPADRAAVQSATAELDAVESATAKLDAVQSRGAAGKFDASLLTALEDADQSELALVQAAAAKTPTDAFKALAKEVASVVAQEQKAAASELKKLGVRPTTTQRSG